MESSYSSSFSINSKGGTKSKAVHTVISILRLVIGAIFLVFGLNGFFHFIPMPPPSGDAGAFAMGLMKGGYFFPMMAFFETLTGLLLLSGFLVPFALILLFPLSLNILLFHLFLSSDGTGMAVFIFLANIGMAYYYKDYYKALFMADNAWKLKS